jgi:hypothetical protein
LPFDEELSLAHELLFRSAWREEELDDAFLLVPSPEELDTSETMSTPVVAEVKKKTSSFLRKAFSKSKSKTQYLPSSSSFAESSIDVGRQLVMLTERTLMLVEVYASKDAKPEVLWSIDISNIEKVTCCDGGSKLVVEKKYKRAELMLEKIGKSGIWKGRTIVCEDQFLSWEYKGKSLGSIRFSSDECRCSGRKISVSGNITSQSKKGRKAGKMKEIVLRAGTIRAAAEFCGAMKGLEVCVENVESERVKRLVFKVMSMVRDLGEESGGGESREQGGKRRSMFFSDEDAGIKDEAPPSEEDEEQKEEEEFNIEDEDSDDGGDHSSVFVGTPGRERNESLDSIASINSLEDMVVL